MTNLIRIMVVDDHPVVRKGIVSMLETEPDLQVLCECKNGAEAVEQALALKPDVILMDLMMPGMDGVEAIQRIKKEINDVRILVLTSFNTSDKVIPSIAAGALGYLLKDSDPEDLILAIHNVFEGKLSLHPLITQQVLSQLTQSPPSKQNLLDDLTERELEVLKFIGHGYNNQQIAEIMVISEATVHSHVSRILNKLQLNNRTQAALFALRKGLVSLNQTEG